MNESDNLSPRTLVLNKSASFGLSVREVAMYSIQNWTLSCKNLYVFGQNTVNTQWRKRLSKKAVTILRSNNLPN